MSALNEPAQPKRHDPPRSTNPDGAINEITRWKNIDPARVYCEANPNDHDTGVPEMKRLGWEVELQRKGGPVLIGGDAASDGSACTRNGMILMSRSREKHVEYEREKFAVADDRSRAIGRLGGADQVAGVYGHAHNTADSRERVVRS